MSRNIDHNYGPPTKYPERTVGAYELGDEVGYSKAWLYSTHGSSAPLSEVAHKRGIVRGKDDRWLYIDWNDGRALTPVHPNSVAKVGSAPWCD